MFESFISSPSYRQTLAVHLGLKDVCQSCLDDSEVMGTLATHPDVDPPSSFGGKDGVLERYKHVLHLDIPSDILQHCKSFWGYPQ